MSRDNAPFLLPGEDLTAFHRRRGGITTRDSKHFLVIPRGRRRRSGDGPITEGVRKTGEIINKTSEAVERNRAGGGDATSGRRRRQARDEEVTQQGTPPQNNLNYEYDPDEDEDEDRAIGTLDPPPENMVYRLERRDGGVIALVLVPDDGGVISTSDRTYRHRIQDGPDPVLVNMNKKNRAFHRTGDADATVRRTLFSHQPNPDEGLALRANKDGSFDILLVSPSVDLIGTIPVGAQNLYESGEEPLEETYGWNSEVDPDPDDDDDEPSIRELSRRTSMDSGYTPLYSEAAKLREMNDSAKEFWRRK